jgi:cytochrome c-type biogenesis protein CcmH
VRLLRVVLLTTVFSVLVFACAAHQELSSIEQRTQDINRLLMCPICPGESIDQSQNNLAKQMRGIVRDQIELGWTDQEIRTFWIERYGPSVLMEPPQSGFNLLAWVVPFVFLLGAMSTVYMVLRSMRNFRGRSGSEEITATIELSEDERARYFRAIENSLEIGQDPSDEAAQGEQRK